MRLNAPQKQQTQSVKPAHFGYSHHQADPSFNQTPQINRGPLQTHYQYSQNAVNRGITPPNAIPNVPMQSNVPTFSNSKAYVAMEKTQLPNQLPQRLPHYHPAYQPPPPESVVPLHNGYPPPYPHQNHTPPHLMPHQNPMTPSLPPYGIQSQQNAFTARPHLKDANTVGNPLPEAHSVVVNFTLSDSMLNLFKDHNFESCTICVCNMNIKGSDVDVYLPSGSVPGFDEPQYKCSCGFSAVTSRHRSHFAGLFYEDEIESTGFVYDPCEGLTKKSYLAIENKPPNDTSSDHKENKADVNSIKPKLIDLLTIQCSNVLSSCSCLIKAVQFEVIKSQRSHSLNNFPTPLDIRKKNNPLSICYKDGCEALFMALFYGKSALNSLPNKHLMLQSHNDDSLVKMALHEWSYQNAPLPSNNQEVVRLLRGLQPLLQESVQNRKRTKMWDVTYHVSGPLTWRQFHRLAGRGTEDQCEPQPIPSLLVGHDKDWVALSPFALKFWDKLLLEPYSYSRDVAYIVVAPDNQYVLSHIRTFFKELSATYEMLRLGKHSPITKVLREGILRVGINNYKRVAEEPIDDWFNQIGGDIGPKIKMYAQICRHYLVPLLNNEQVDKSIFDTKAKQTNETNGSNNSSNIGNNTSKAQSTSPHPAESVTAEKSLEETASDSATNSSQNSTSQQAQEVEQDEDHHKQPAIVIYIVEPFTFASLDEDLYRRANVGLLRSYSHMFDFLSPHIQNSIHLQLISLDSIMNYGRSLDETSKQDHFKSLALSVFGQCRQTLVHQSNVKSLTGFGPAAVYETFLKTKDKNSSSTRNYTPPFILAPLKDKQTELGEMFGDRREKSQVLYCCYCLTEDQRWLLASCTNDKGDLLETTCINIEIPNRPRRRKANVIDFALRKLMRFIQSTLSDSVQPWRLVIGRLGRIGHGELKRWACLLSKKSLLNFSRQLREMCTQCSYLTPFDQPAIFSACLISLEADPVLRVFPDQYTPDDRFSSSCNTCNLSTPEDASCTHILVFPTSATTQSNQAHFSIEALGANEDDILTALDVEDDINVGELFQWTEDDDAALGSPQRDGLSQPESPSARQSGFGGSGSMKVSPSFLASSPTITTSLPRLRLLMVLTVKSSKSLHNYYSSLLLSAFMCQQPKPGRFRDGFGHHVLNWSTPVPFFLR